MVLQGRIELPTSPLPRECSTTELLQRVSGLLQVRCRSARAFVPISREGLRSASDRATNPPRLDAAPKAQYHRYHEITPSKPAPRGGS